MKKLELIALFVLTVLVEISTPVSLYTIISDAEHVTHDNRLPKKLQPVEVMVENAFLLCHTSLTHPLLEFRWMQPTTWDLKFSTCTPT